MPFRIYDTLTQTEQTFETAEPGHARIYVCGPTVYDFSHLGHVRCYVVYDVLYRHLLASGYRVTYARNITDVDDKILKRAAERGENPSDVAERFTVAFREDMDRLGNKRPTIEPKVSGTIPEIIAIIETLIARGHAYASAGDVYFDVASDPDYGKLSHRNLEQMLAGASGRLDADEVDRKKHPADFALWKGSNEGQWGWQSPWGYGRPGWHIECSAMAKAHLGESFDLHGGGLDLVFPHHENEIAQSECASGKPLARIWMHNGFVETDKEKMSKSLGNFFTARDLFERHEPEALRWFALTVHYRSPLAFDWEIDDAGAVRRFPPLEEAEKKLEYVYATKLRLTSLPVERIYDDSAGVPATIAGLDERVASALDADLNMPVALSHVSAFLGAVNELCDAATRKKGKVSRSVIDAARTNFQVLTKRLGVGADDAERILVRIRDRRAAARGVDGAHVESLIARRAEARAAKDFEAADAVRTELASLGVTLLDGEGGTTWTLPA